MFYRLCVLFIPLQYSVIAQIQLYKVTELQIHQKMDTNWVLQNIQEPFLERNWNTAILTINPSLLKPLELSKYKGSKIENENPLSCWEAINNNGAKKIPLFLDKNPVFLS